MMFRQLFFAAALVSLASAFGPATPVFAGVRTSVNNNNAYDQHQLTMRVSMSEMKNRQKVKRILGSAVVAGSDPAATKRTLRSL